MPRQIGLVAAPRARRGGVLQAREQFDASPLFRRARDYCERVGWEWYILSASHGLLTPRQVVSDNGAHIQTLSPDDRMRWAREIAARLRDLAAHTSQPLEVTLLASQRYAEMIGRAASDIPLITPLAGLGVSERLQWFEERLRVRSRLLTPDTL
jgi:hypothetical protein